MINARWSHEIRSAEFLFRSLHTREDERRIRLYTGEHTPLAENVCASIVFLATWLARNGGLFSEKRASLSDVVLSCARAF